MPAALQLVVMALVGGAAAGAAAVMLAPALIPLVGWDAAALSWLALQWTRLSRLDAARTARLAKLEDPNRATRDALLLAACLASLLAVGLVLTMAHDVRAGLVRDLYGALGVLSIVVSWFVVHTVYTTRYARLFYSGEPGGINFHQDEPPCFSDFAYVGFTVGATFQVSDTDLCTSEMRRTALRHLLLSYLFGAVIIAATVNLLASLAQ
ncbi:DUF1345 domain-containing protein [Micromonospora sp. AMSO31t]|uniref:DUF1345 domain-containing protein n=1 Tax=Micromonospora sp. AMSO31t TaxID=2650566 RepID=UPI00124B206F|nr:DUF1345 domain-containing protein [Micromonospora sp. AMSO31t]KAB1905136.1 DUF1345 domain-containing protein [Micromonospora sp. AMSO31t]